MTVPGNVHALMLGGEQGYKIERSLRFNSADSAYLNRTPASAGNRRTWTWSAWVKFSSINVSSNGIFEAATNSSNRSVLVITGNSQLQWFDSSGGSTVTQLLTSQVFRDFSAWYHIVLAVDTTQATSSNRVKIYVNGSQVTAFGTATYPSQNFDTQVNATVATVLGAGTAYTPAFFYDGYLTEINFIDGQALTPSSFGETDTITGVWKPKKYTGTYGTNGFYLNFSDNSGTTSTTLGKDSSGNSNNWTPNNFSVTAGAGNDSMIDTPTPYADGGNGRGNYCTLNPLGVAGAVPTNGNLAVSSSSTVGNRISTFLLTSGKWYWEGSGTGYVGAIIGRDGAQFTGSISGTGSKSIGYWPVDGGAYWDGGSSGTGTAYTSTDIIGVALDMDAGNVKFYKNNTLIHNLTFGSGTIPNLSSGVFPGYNVGANTTSVDFNFGQRPFAHTPPSGFVALNTQNLPEPSIKKSSSYFDAKLYTGNGGTQTISGLGFSPDLVWTKGRGSATYNNHLLYDSVRGTNKILQSNQTAAESTLTTGLTSFNSDGFTIGAFDDGNTNANTYVAWCWDESATPGFDIVTYTGNGSARTIAHSLGVAPSMMVIKRRDAAENWGVYHTSLGNTQYVYLDQTQGANTSANFWNNTSPTSSVFSVAGSTVVNASGGTYVAYLWSEVANFSKFGSYTGNGSSDGPFVFCGFRPRWVMIKNASTTSDWFIYDTSRNTYNVNDSRLYANLSNAEGTGGSYGPDILSNGFKMRTSFGEHNGSGNTIIFAAFAETPFRNALAR